MSNDTIDKGHNRSVISQLMERFDQNHLMDERLQIEFHSGTIELLLLLPDDDIGIVSSVNPVGHKAANGIPDLDIVLLESIDDLHEDAVKAVDIVSLSNEGGVGITKMDTDGEQ